jgi:hypothetical protein
MRTIAGNGNGAPKMPMSESISKCRSNAVSEGFKDVFSLTPRGLYSLTTSRYYRPEQVTVLRCQRFESENGQTENGNLYMIEMTDGVKGILAEPTSGMRDPEITRFIREAERIQSQMSQLGRNQC